MPQPAELNQIDFMNHPSRWPFCPFLPVKNCRKDLPNRPWDGMPHCGILVAMPRPLYGGLLTSEPTVYMLGIHNLQVPVSKELLENTPQFKYATIDEMVARGWQVE